MSHVLGCTVVRPWFHTAAAVADRRKENFPFSTRSQWQFVGEKEAVSFMEVLQSAMAVLETLPKGSGSQGWLALSGPFIFSDLHEFLWKLSNIQLPLPHFPHALRNSKGKLVPWDPGSMPDVTRDVQRCWAVGSKCTGVIASCSKGQERCPQAMTPSLALLQLQHLEQRQPGSLRSQRIGSYRGACP